MQECRSQFPKKGRSISAQTGRREMTMQGRGQGVRGTAVSLVLGSNLDLFLPASQPVGLVRVGQGLATFPLLRFQKNFLCDTLSFLGELVYTIFCSS